jgi:hypothetical protein
VTNAGTATAQAPWIDAIYSSPSGGMPIGSFTNITSLPAGGSYTRTLMVPTPFCATGQIALCIVADVDNNVNAGSCAANSSACSQSELQLSYPDIQISSIFKPQSVSGGSPFQVRWMVYNAGNLPASGPWAEVLYR